MTLAVVKPLPNVRLVNDEQFWNIYEQLVSAVEVNLLSPVMLAKFVQPENI